MNLIPQNVLNSKLNAAIDRVATHLPPRRAELGQLRYRRKHTTLR